MSGHERGGVQGTIVICDAYRFLHSEVRERFREYDKVWWGFVWWGQLAKVRPNTQSSTRPKPCPRPVNLLLLPLLRSPLHNFRHILASNPHHAFLPAPKGLSCVPLDTLGPRLTELSIERELKNWRWTSRWRSSWVCKEPHECFEGDVFSVLYLVIRARAFSSSRQDQWIKSKLVDSMTVDDLPLSALQSLNPPPTPFPLVFRPKLIRYSQIGVSRSVFHSQFIKVDTNYPVPGPTLSLSSQFPNQPSSTQSVGMRFLVRLRQAGGYLLYGRIRQT